MKQSVLFGTASQAKLDHVKALLSQLPVHIVSPADVGLAIEVKEDGDTAEANARIKALAYCDLIQMPTFAIDAGLTVDAFPDDWQPGVYVRRVRRDDEQLDDRELISHYRERLYQVGGNSSGRWHVGIALVIPNESFYQASYQIETRFNAVPSDVIIDDAPLSSLMQDPSSGRYYSEMDYAERPDSAQLRATLLTLFEHLVSDSSSTTSSHSAIAAAKS